MRKIAQKGASTELTDSKKSEILKDFYYQADNYSLKALLFYPLQIMQSLRKNLNMILMFGMIATASAFNAKDQNSDLAQEDAGLVSAEISLIDPSELAYSFFSIGPTPKLLSSAESVAYNILQNWHGLHDAGFPPQKLVSNSKTWSNTIKTLTPALIQWSEATGIKWQQLSSRELKKLVRFLQKRSAKIARVLPEEHEPFLRAVADLPQLSVKSPVTLAHPEHGPTVWVSPTGSISYGPLLSYTYPNPYLEIHNPVAPLIITMTDLAMNNPQHLQQKLTIYLQRQSLPENQKLYSDLLSKYLHDFYMYHYIFLKSPVVNKFRKDDSLKINSLTLRKKIINLCVNKIDPKFLNDLNFEIAEFQRKHSISDKEFESALHKKTLKAFKKELKRVLPAAESFTVVKPFTKGNFSFDPGQISLGIRAQLNQFHQKDAIHKLAEYIQKEYQNQKRKYQHDFVDLQNQADKVIAKVKSIPLGKMSLQLFAAASTGHIIFVDNYKEFPELNPIYGERGHRGAFDYLTQTIVIAKNPDFLTDKLDTIPLWLLLIEASTGVPFAHQIMLDELLHAACYFIGQTIESIHLSKQDLTAPYWTVLEKIQFNEAKIFDSIHLQSLLELGSKVLQKTQLSKTEEIKWDDFINKIKPFVSPIKDRNYRRLLINSQEAGAISDFSNRYIGRAIMKQPIPVARDYWVDLGAAQFVNALCDRIIYWAEESKPYQYKASKEQLNANAVTALQLAYSNLIQMKQHYTSENEDSEILSRYGHLVMAYDSEEMIQWIAPKLYDYIQVVFKKRLETAYIKAVFASMDKTVDDDITTPLKHSHAERSILYQM